ncbi:MAG: PEGA domain-containing protein [Tepidisphaeraceae bacterium]|jgi:hypothetical protein
MRWFANSLLLLACGGCCTVLRGTHQTMAFDTNPRGTVVEVDGTRYTTPVNVVLKRTKSYPITLVKAGYRMIRFDLTPEWDGVSLVGNMIMPGGSLGLVMDAADGADHNFYELAEISMVPSTQPSDPPLILNAFKGHLLTDEQLVVAIRADRLDRSQFFRGEP